MREAVIRADLDDLLEQDPQRLKPAIPALAQKLRRLAEGFEYQKLLDLFDQGEPAESSLSPAESLP